MSDRIETERRRVYRLRARMMSDPDLIRRPTLLEVCRWAAALTVATKSRRMSFTTRLSAQAVAKHVAEQRYAGGKIDIRGAKRIVAAMKATGWFESVPNGKGHRAQGWRVIDKFAPAVAASPLPDAFPPPSSGRLDAGEWGPGNWRGWAEELHPETAQLPGWDAASPGRVEAMAGAIQWAHNAGARMDYGRLWAATVYAS